MQKSSSPSDDYTGEPLDAPEEKSACPTTGSDEGEIRTERIGYVLLLLGFMQWVYGAVFGIPAFYVKYDLKLVPPVFPILAFMAYFLGIAYFFHEVSFVKRMLLSVVFAGALMAVSFILFIAWLLIYTIGIYPAT